MTGASPLPTASATGRSQPLAFALLGVVAWTVLLASALRTELASSDVLPLFNSDFAIPVLMANAARVDRFFLYYLGQDRSGAGHWILLNWLRRALGSGPWTPVGLSRIGIACAVAGAWPFARLIRAWAGLPLFACVLLLHPSLRGWMFELGQPYGWQLALVLAGMVLLREAVERPGAVRLGAAAVLAALGTWVSTTTPVLLGGFFLTDQLLARPWPEQRARLRRWWGPLGVILGGALFERVVRGVYHRDAIHRFHYDYRTHVALDLGHLRENLAAMARVYWQVPGAALGLLGVLTGLALIARGARAGARAPGALARSVAGFAVAAALAFAVTVAVSWVRDNGYSERYLVPCFFFATAAGVLSPWVWLGWLGVDPGRRTLELLAPIAALGAWALLHPPAQTHPDYLERQRAAQWATAGQTHVLLGGYWGSYVLAAQGPELEPHVLEADYQRMPWLEEGLAAVPEVLVSTEQTELLGPQQEPVGWLLDRDAVFERDPQAPWRAAGWGLFRYRNRTGQVLASAREGDSSDCASQLTVRWSGAARFALIRWRESEPPKLLRCEHRTAAGARTLQSAEAMAVGQSRCELSPAPGGGELRITADDPARCVRARVAILP